VFFAIAITVPYRLDDKDKTYSRYGHYILTHDAPVVVLYNLMYMDMN